MEQMTLLGIEDDAKIYFNLSQLQLATVMREYACRGGCFLSTARVESFGLGVVESMACGLPVVASDVGAIREHILHGETGYLFPFGERVLAADLIEECLFLRQSRARIVANLDGINVDKWREPVIEQLYRIYCGGRKTKFVRETAAS
jgi:glycosyltransferase involved in cell wall biosynthesis